MQVKRQLISALIFVATVPKVIIAQEKTAPQYGWSEQMVAALNLNQVTFSNWTQGGENTVSWQIILDSKATRKAPRFDWVTTGTFTFGKTKLGDSEFRKSVDEIKIESVWTYKAGLDVNPYVAVTALTQFTAGYQYGDTSRTQISDFLDPAYFTQSLGLGYEPITDFKTRLGFAMKETITRRFPKPYADDPATPTIEKTRVEAGMTATLDFQRKLNQIVKLTSKADLFSNLGSIQEVDVNWDTLITAQISKWMHVNFNLKLIYDRNVSRSRQIKQALAVGISYSFL